VSIECWQTSVKDTVVVNVFLESIACDGLYM